MGRILGKWMCVVALSSCAMFAQNLPDAPAPKPTPAGQFPEDAPPAARNDRPAEQPAAVSTPAPSPTPAQPARIQGLSTDKKELPLFTIHTNFVVLPVIVKDNSGRLISGLNWQDFTVYEDGTPQKLSFFTSDSLPLSAAIVVDTDLPAPTMKKVNDSLPALVGAFSEYDEVALYSYSHTVSQVSGYTGAANLPTATLARLKRPGREGGPPQVFGPLAGPPSINGHPVTDPNAQVGTAIGASGIPNPVSESWVLNDAILRAAQDLGRRDRARRKIIFVISDGRELGSKAGLDEVRKVLLTYNIAVFAVGVDVAATPIYDKLNRPRVPGFGYQNILPRYVVDTGGEAYNAFDRNTIEQSYSRITDLARNQYTLGYNAALNAAGACRTIDVHVHRPNLNVRAKQAYCPLPPSPRAGGQ
ncbi:MAG TPA: VWA domain-containing protein [Candidatus Angelobacter sp.]|nr:VWA domain-containing protein [Candidatus Angelobacter sp.]